MWAGQRAISPGSATRSKQDEPTPRRSLLDDERRFRVEVADIPVEMGLSGKRRVGRDHDDLGVVAV